MNAIRDYSAFVSKRYQATKATGKYVYILTNVQEGKEKGAGLIGVNLDTGETNRQVMLKDKNPDYKQQINIARSIFGITKKSLPIPCNSIIRSNPEKRSPATSFLCPFIQSPTNAEARTQ